MRRRRVAKRPNDETRTADAMISEATVTCSRSPRRVKARLRQALHAVGYDTADWMRIVMHRRCFAFVRSLAPGRLDALEISGGPQWVREFQFRSYTAAAHPGFDICFQTLPDRFDLIIADQVFEHLKWPYRAARNVMTMLRPGGHFIITVPFLVRIQKLPQGVAPVLPRAVPQAAAGEIGQHAALVDSCSAR